MPDSTIRVDDSIVTLINVFTVAREDQQRLIDCWQRATEEVMSRLPGFISANIHRSVDGTKVVNYAQWRGRKTLEGGGGDWSRALGRREILSTPHHWPVHPVR